MLTKKEELQRLAREYREAGQEWPASTNMMAAWAVREKRFDLAAPSLIRLLAKDLSQALSQEYFTDEQGRRVRAKHPYKIRKDGKQLVLWDDIREMPRKNVERAVRMRRGRITHECKQLKTDVDSFNDANSTERPIQLSLDFTKDVKELELAEGLDVNLDHASLDIPGTENYITTAVEIASTL